MRAYEEGRKAFKDGDEFWMNPYSAGSGSKTAFHAWFAGWCYQKKMAETGAKESITDIYLRWLKK